MRENMKERRLALPVLFVFGPQIDDLAIQTNVMFGRGMNQASGGKPFGGGPDQDRRFFGPADRLLPVTVAVSKMQDFFAMAPDTDRGAEFA